MTETVLIVEDTDILRRNLTECLRRSGVNAVSAGSVADARRILAKTPVSLICVDIQLGDGDGIDLVGDVRRTDPSLPVVVMTGRDCVHNRTRAEGIDASAFLAKPFSMARFRELIATLLLEETGSRHSDLRGPSVLMYSHDTIGLGHMRRNSNIAAHIVRSMPGASVLMLVGSPTGMIFDLPPGVDFIKLPSLAKVSRNVWRPGKLRISSGHTKDIRAGLIERAIESFRPDLLLVDHEPLGVWDELVPSLTALRQSPDAPYVVLGLRDILDDPERTRRDWASRGISEKVGGLYDEIFVYGDPDIFPADRAYGLAGMTRSPVRYCGYVTNTQTQPARGSAERRGGPRILISGGGGRDAYPMMRASLDALAQLPELFRENAQLITGPLMDQELREDLFDRAIPAGIGICTSVPDLPARLGEADLFVTMGGYNALTEALAAGCPTLVIPRVGPSAEQRLRAELFAGRGFLDTLPSEEATPRRLAGIFRAVKPGTARRTPPFAFDGAASAAGRIVDVLTQRSPRAIPEERRAANDG